MVCLCSFIVVLLLEVGSMVLGGGFDFKVVVEKRVLVWVVNVGFL